MDRKEEIAELKAKIKEAQETLDKGGMNLTEQTMVELYLDQWKKDLKALKKELKIHPNK